MNQLYFPIHFHEVREMMQNEQEKLHASFSYESKSLRKRPANQIQNEHLKKKTVIKLDLLQSRMV